VLQILWLKTAGGLLKDVANSWKHSSERLSSQEILDDHVLNLTKWFEIKRGLSKLTCQLTLSICVIYVWF
jgi:hypothetical protein